MSLELKKSAASRNLGRGINILLEFSHSAWTETFKFIDNTESITVDSDTYEPFPFKFTQNAQGETSGSSIVLANVDRTIARQIKLATGNESIQCRVYICHVEQDNTTIVGERLDRGLYEVFNPTITTESITMNLNLRLSLNFNASSLRYNPSVFRNIYL